VRTWKHGEIGIGNWLLTPIVGFYGVFCGWDAEFSGIWLKLGWDYGIVEFGYK